MSSSLDPSLSLHFACGSISHGIQLQENLTLDQRKPTGRRPAPPPPRPENVPPRDRKPAPRPHRDDVSRRRQPPEKPLIDIFADPSEGPSKLHSSSRRPRRNSDSSLMERPPRHLDPEEERRRRERRHREREARSKDGKSSRSRRNNRALDVIDKLDVTGIYGSACKYLAFRSDSPSLILTNSCLVFHHDGPFDACNPHRNRKGIRAAPMQAFPKDSRNMAIGGAGPVNNDLDLNQFHGRGAEGYSDFGDSGIYSAYKKSNGVSFDPSSKLEPVHGAESMGLGTSTFLEGTPASRAAIQRRQSEYESQLQQNGGLQRKKSLAQKIRGINNRGGGGHHRVVSPEAIVGEPNTLRPSTGRSTSAKRPVSRNPFFQDYDDAYDQKGAKIQEAANDYDVTRPRSVSSPKSVPGLERRVTTDTIADTFAAEESKPAASGGFMSRMKSLRRPKPERRPTGPSKNDVW